MTAFHPNIGRTSFGKTAMPSGLQLSEGIKKEDEDFAAEIAATLKG